MRKIFLFFTFLFVLILAGCTPHPTDTDTGIQPPVTTAPSVTSAVVAGSLGPLETEITRLTTDCVPPAVSPEEVFNNSVFIGDSIMEGIRQYVVRQRKTEPTLGDARFIATTIGISLADLVGDKQNCLYYSYRGKEQPLADILAELGTIDRIFLMLGMNDLAAGDADTDTAVTRYLRLVENLSEQFPKAEIVILTNTPKVASAWLPNYIANRELDNALISDFVQKLVAMCDQNGILYVDTHAALCDANGNLPDDYCRDGYIHLSDAGSRVVVEALYRFAEATGER